MMTFRFHIQRLNLAGWISLLGILLTISPALAAPERGEAGNRRSIRPQAHQAVRMSLNDLEIEIPAGAAEQEISVETVADDLAGITKPRGFRAVGNIIRFGPHGMRFREGKELRFRLKVTGDHQNARLYYINRQTNRLEAVDSKFDRASGVMEAKLRHFSDYVPGVTPGWDGNGINPFFDITHGEETVKVPDRTLSVRSTVLSLPGRGINFNLVRATSEYPLECLKISDNWYWDLPCIYIDSYGNCRYNIPGLGTLDYGTGDLRAHERYGRKDETVYNLNGICFLVERYDDETPVVRLKDGTTIETTGWRIRVTDPNGNWYQYDFLNSWGDSENTFPRISKLTDSLGRVLSFSYDTSGNLIKVEQLQKNGQRKTVLTYDFKGGERFTDAKGRTTTYYYGYGGISQIVYPNGAKSEYSYDTTNWTEGPKVTQQRFVMPNQTAPRRVVDYGAPFFVASGGQQMVVTDNGKIKKYNFKWPGGNCYITREATYSHAGELLEQKDFTYYPEIYDYDMIKTLTTATVTASGVLGQPATYQYEYDNWGNTTKVTDPNGTVTVMAYANTNSNSNLATRTVTEMRTEWRTETRPKYDEEGYIIYKVEYGYDSDGYLCYWYLHDENGDLIPETETVTYSVQVPYTYTVPTGYQNPLYPANLRYIWDRMLTRATLVNDPVHGTTQLNQTHYQYDAKGNLLKESTVHNGGYLDTAYTYDTYGNVLTKTDANGQQLGFEYGSAYNSAYLTRVYKPENNQTIATFGYDFDTGLKTQATDPNGNRFSYAYDLIGRLTREGLENADSNLQITRTLGYDDFNSILTLHFGNDSKGWQEGRIVYDPLFGKPTTIQRKQNGTWVTQRTFIYDTSGRLIQETDGMGHTTAYAYDELDRKVKTTRPDGAVTTQTWDDRTVTITDPKGNRKIQTYDLLDRLVQTQEFPDGTTPVTTSYSYDTYDDPFSSKNESHLVQVKNPKGAETKYTYDNLGRLTRLDYPQDGANPMAAETYAYDSVGNLIRKTQGSKVTTMDYQFLAGYRLWHVYEPGRTVTHAYDNNDNLTMQTTAGVTYDYHTYDARNRVTYLTATIDGISFDFHYDYDVYGRMTSLSYPNRTSPVTYSYDELDRLQSIPGFVNSCSYDLDNKLTQMTYANGVANNYSYDVNDQPTAIAAGSLLSLSYGYDPVGNITRINSDYYGYDGLNRLTWYGSSATPGSGTGTRWSYDGAGNMASKTKYLNGASQGVTSFGYDLANRLWSMGAISYSNDQYGNRIQKSQTGENFNYMFDGENRLSQVAKNSATVLQNLYDGNGMRVKRTENGKAIYYIYSGPNPLMEYSPTDGTYLYRFYAGKTAIAEEKGGVIKFYHKDHLGSTRVVTNAAGAKIAEYKLAPYGEKEIALGDGTDYQFTDKAEDEASGLYYFGARFYDPETGRFITRDTFTYMPNDERIMFDLVNDQEVNKIIRIGLKYPEVQNSYVYCLNNPLRFIDLDGNEAQESSDDEDKDEDKNDEKKEHEESTKENNEMFKFYGQLQEKKEELLNTYNDKKIITEKLKEWGEKKLTQMVAKGIITSIAMKIGYEMITITTQNINIPSAGLGLGFKAVGAAGRGLTWGAKFAGACVGQIIDFLWFSAKPCY
jgi:RHS repeat-associated protein